MKIAVYSLEHFIHLFICDTHSLRHSRPQTNAQMKIFQKTKCYTSECFTDSHTNALVENSCFQSFVFLKTSIHVVIAINWIKLIFIFKRCWIPGNSKCRMSLQRFDVETNFVVRRRKHGKETGWEKNQREGERKEEAGKKHLFNVSVSLSVSICLCLSLYFSLPHTHILHCPHTKIGICWQHRIK